MKGRVEVGVGVKDKNTRRRSIDGRQEGWEKSRYRPRDEEEGQD